MVNNAETLSASIWGFAYSRECGSLGQLAVSKLKMRIWPAAVKRPEPLSVLSAIDLFMLRVPSNFPSRLCSSRERESEEALPPAALWHS
jgi:hypothetical protein